MTVADLYGVLAEYDTGDALVQGVEQLRSAGFSSIEVYTPYPLDSLSQALSLPRSRLPLLVLLGGLIAGVGIYLLQWFTATIAYPLNIGGRPLNSWPAFIPIAAEVTFLGAALAGVIGMLIFTRLPRYHHPLFSRPGFERASQDRFFLCITHADPRFESQQVRAALVRTHPLDVSDVAK